MTDLRADDLVKLADRLIAQDYGDVSDVDALGPHFALLAEAATTLRRLAEAGTQKADQTVTSNSDVAEALSQAFEYFDNRSDVVDGDYGIPEPNTEMRLAQICSDALDKLATPQCITPALITAPQDDVREALKAASAIELGEPDTTIFPTPGLSSRVYSRDQIIEFANRRVQAALRGNQSDGGAKAGSSPILANKEEQRAGAHGMTPVGIVADAAGCTDVGPSDPSSTRSDVTVRMLASVLLDCPAGSATAMARALLDQFEITRRK